MPLFYICFLHGHSYNAQTIFNYIYIYICLRYKVTNTSEQFFVEDIVRKQLV